MRGYEPVKSKSPALSIATKMCMVSALRRCRRRAQTNAMMLHTAAIKQAPKNSQSTYMLRTRFRVVTEQRSNDNKPTT